jgi:hypothetical protein
VNPKKKPEPFFPKDRDKGRVFEIYRDSKIDYFYHWFQSGHVMDIRLRQGETLTRWWRPQGGRWHHLEAYNKGFVRKLLEKEPRGYKSNHSEFSVWTQGNGLWEYEPNLTASSNDFEDGVHHAANLQAGVDGLSLKDDGTGEAVFEIFTPWTIVPKVNDLDDPTDDSDASVIDIDAASPIEVFLSLNRGKTWVGITGFDPGQHSVDLTQWVKGKFGYLVKFQSLGKAGDLVMRTMSIKTWVQVAPISLPRLKEGVNRCRYDIGDRYGKSTKPAFVIPNVADSEDLKHHVVELPKDYDLARKTSRIRGDVILKLEAADGETIDWFTAGACFTTHQTRGAANTDNRIAYAVGKPEAFNEIYKANVPTWVQHWRYQWDQDVNLEEPAKAVYVRYTGKPGVNVIRATMHMNPVRAPQKNLRITHGYKVGQNRVEKVIEMDKPGDYTINVAGKPANEFIRMAVPSNLK